MFVLDERSLIAMLPYDTSISCCDVIKRLILYEGKKRKIIDQENLSHNSAQPYAIECTSNFIIR